MKIKTASFTLIASLLVLAIVISALSLLNQSKTRVVEELWLEFDEARSDRLNAILAIRREMGFGGMIHHYKNFILRSKVADKDAVIASIGGVQSAIKRYRALEITTTESNALSDIEATLNLYAGTLATITALQRRQRTPNEIDTAVKINENSTIAALNKLALEAKYIDNVRPDSKNTNKAIWLGKLRTALGYGGLIHAFKNYILRGTPESLAKVKKKVNEIRSIIDNYLKLNVNEIEKNALRKVLQVVSLYYERIPTIESMILTNAVANRIDNAVIVDDRPAIEGLNELYREIIKENNNQSTRLKRSLDIALKSGQTIFVTTVVSFMLIIIWAVWLLRYKITRPLIQLNANMTSLAKEDLEVDISGVNAQTEIGDMARAVEVFKLNAIDKLKMEAALKQSNERLEEAVSERTQALRSKEKRLSSLIENTVDAIITIDQHGTIQSFNTAAILMFGYSANEVVGKNVKCLMPEPYRSEHDGYLANYLNTAEKKIIGVGREALAKRKNGEEFPIDLAVSEVETIDDTVIFTGIIRDITKQKEHEQELYLAAKDAAQANRAKSEFLSAMSHELRTPLNAVIGFSQLLASDKLHPLNEEQKQSITYILESGNQLLGLVDDILDLSKIENGQLNVVYEPVELNMVVEQSVKLVQTQADSKSIKIDNQLANQLPQHVNADVKKLRQVILNILSNAIKYNVDGGEVCIYTKITNEDTVRLSFSDTGHGIAESVLEHLFEPFNRLGKEKSSIQGTGIGLTISKNLTELMGGRLGAENNLDKGMTFWIELTTYHGVHEDQKARGHQG